MTVIKKKRKKSRGQYLKSILQFSEMSSHDLCLDSSVAEQITAGIIVLRFTSSYCWRKFCFYRSRSKFCFYRSSDSQVYSQLAGHLESSDLYIMKY